MYEKRNSVDARIPTYYYLSFYLLIYLKNGIMVTMEKGKLRINMLSSSEKWQAKVCVWCIPVNLVQL